MALNFAVRKKLDDYLDTIALTDIEKFSPSKFSKYIDISIDEIFKWLLEHVSDGELNLIWEIRCPNCNRVLTLNSNKDFEEYECDFCHEIFDVEANDLYPKFSVSKDYKDYLLAEKRESNSEKKLGETITNADKENPLSDFHLDDYMKEILYENSPNNINLIINGDVSVNNNNNISDSFNHSKLDNNNIQSEITNKNPLVPQKQVEDLEDIIEQIDEEDLKQMNKEFLDNFKTSLKEHDKDQAKKWIGYIRNTLNAPIIQTITQTLN